MRFIFVSFICLSLLTEAQVPTSARALETALSPDENAHLLDGDFRIVTKVEALPVEIREELAHLFRQKKLELADPDERFNAGDVGIPGRRLIFAGTSSDKCFVHYEQGGFAHMYRIVVFQVDAKRKVTFLWGGSGYHASDLHQLRSAIASGRFRD